MDAAESEQRHETLDTADVRRVGCKHKLGKCWHALSENKSVIFFSHLN